MRQPLLRQNDQLSVAALVLVALASMAVYWIQQGGFRGELIEIDHAHPAEARFLVNVNQAEWPELAQLPSIGPTLAKRIVDRRRKAQFTSREQLLEVEGIGPRRLAQIRKYLLPLPEDPQVAER